MDEREHIKQSYDELAETYAEMTSGGDDELGASLVEQFFNCLDGDRLLDAGCGSSPTTRPGVTTVGLDISRGQLQQARPTDQNTCLVQGEMTSLPFPADTFDGVTAFFSLIHVPLDDHQAVLDEFARVLREGGVVLVTEGESEWCGEQDDWLGDEVGMAWEIAGRDATREHLKSADFEVIDEMMVTDPLADGDHSKPFFLAEHRG